MKYWTAINTGYGFITNHDRINFNIEGKPLNIWITDVNQAAHQWAERNNAIEITQAEAEALLASLPPMLDILGVQQ